MAAKCNDVRAGKTLCDHCARPATVIRGDRALCPRHSREPQESSLKSIAPELAEKFKK